MSERGGANLSRRGFLLGAIGAANLWAGSAHANRLRLRRRAGDGAVPTGDIWPGAGWNSTAGSGWGVAGGYARPTSPTRSNGKPWCRALFANYEAISGNYPLSVDAGVSPIAGEIAFVRYSCEGRKVDISAESLFDPGEVNGLPDWRRAFHAFFDCAAAIAMAAQGSAEVFIEAFPSDPLMEVQVEGPFILHPRLPVSGQTDAGPGKVVEKILYCKPSAGSDTAGVRYRSIKSCLDWAVSNYGSTKLVKILCEDANTGYRLQKVATETTGANARKHWTFIEALDGVTGVTMGDGVNLIDPDFSSGLQYDLLTWGKGVKWDWGKACPDGGALKIRTASTQSMRWQACELFCGGFPAAFGGSGTGVNSLINGLTVPGYFVSAQGSFKVNLYFENVYAHDLPDYGGVGARLVRGCKFDMIGGSCFENCWGAIHNTVATRIGGPWTTLLTPANAFQASPTDGATWEVECSGNVGSSSTTRVFKLWRNGTEVLSKNLPKAVRLQELVDAINGVTGVSATSPTGDLAALFLSKAGAGNAGPIARQALTSGFQFTTWVDIHANALIWHTAPIDNVAVRFVRLYNVLGASLISVNESTNAYTGNPKTLLTPGFMDVGIRNCIGVDPGSSHSGGYQGAAFRHVYFGYNTLIGAITNWTDSFDPDAKTQFDHVYAKSFSYSPRTIAPATSTKPAVVAVPNMAITSFAVLASAQLTLPQNADANSKRMAGTEASLFASLADPMAPDATPVAALQLDDGSYPGALSPSGAWQLAA